VLLEELVHSLHVGLDEAARLVGDHAEVELRGASEAQRAHEAIGLETWLAQHLREPSLGGAPVDVHLPEAVLCGDVPLREEDVVQVAGEHVRHAVAVAEDLDALVQAEETLVGIDRR
jgi:hypothetical protein